MKGLLLIVGVILCVGASAKRLDKETVRHLIDRVKKLNGINRQIHAKKSLNNDAAACPLARYHNKRWLEDDPTSDRVARDLFTARDILLDAGYTALELKAQEVQDEFKRQAGSECGATITCTPSPYRSADGTCNNVDNPKWGSTGAAQRRMMGPAYFGSTTDPRNTSVVGTNNALPNPRTVSNLVHRGPANNGAIRSNTINLQTFQMGQFLDHDITLTPLQSDVADCCANRLDTFNCIPIVFPRSVDEVGFFRPRPNTDDEYCMNVRRSAPEPCKAAEGKREQISNITSFIDCSNVYGSTTEEQADLRDGAFMKVDNKYWLPKDESSTFCKLDGNGGQNCNLAGDHRVNVVPSLTAYHTLFAREHNRIAAQLQSEYPNDPETLFQETRRIVIAVMQKIVYGEFLPSFLSDDAMDTYNLRNTESYVYNATIDPTMLNEFGIAYRFGHTWIPGTMDLFDTNFRRLEGVQTRDSFDDMTLTYKTYSTWTDTTPARDVSPAQLAYWLTGEQSAETDRIVIEDARSFLFQNPAERTAFDLVALNIQRARDHGLQPYAKYRELCGLGTVTTFADLSDHTEALQRMLASAYDDPNDIDLFTGTMTEGNQEGSLGPTLECILGTQFRALKFGDRFWYQGVDAGFTTAQLTAIDEYSMAGVLCNNYGFVTVDSPNAFVRSRKRSCNDINRLDISQFKTIPTTTTTTTSTTTTTQAPPPPPPPAGPRPPPNNNRPPQQGRPRPRSKNIEDILEEKEIETIEELLAEELLERLEGN